MHEELVRSHPIDERFKEMLLFIYRARKEESLEWSLMQIHVIDPFSFLDALPRSQADAGEFIVLTNIRGVGSRQPLFDPVNPSRGERGTIYRR